MNWITVAVVLFLLGALSAAGVPGIELVPALSWALAGVAAYIAGGAPRSQA